VKYTVKEIFYSVQGEGVNLGRPAIFVRFAGCNLWSGREEDRAKATCQFCDTDFLGGEPFVRPEDLARRVALTGNSRFVVLTGGEPLLQVDTPLVSALRHYGFEIAIETNGTRPIPPQIDWVCLSPKAGTILAIDTCDELKLVFPQKNLPPERLDHIKTWHRWLSPMDGPHLRRNVAFAVDYAKQHPEWRVNIQAHKAWGVR